MTDAATLCELDAVALAGCLAAGETTSTEVTEALLARIEEIDHAGPELRSVLAVAPDAMAAAQRADAARSAGDRRALLGVPVVVKDNIEAVGLPGTAGATSLSGRAVTADAPLVERLRAAGLVVLGATNLSEWANLRSERSTSGWSAVGGLTVNPHRLDRSAGGSSSGSGAAVAARLAPLAVGTETDGSITCPCSLNGVAGLKPTVGSVPTDGVVPLSRSQDSPGPMARTVADVAVLYEVLGGRDGVAARVAAGAGDVRVGAATTLLTKHPPTDACFEQALTALSKGGTALVDVAYAASSSEEDEDELTVLLCETFDDLSAYLSGRPGDGPRSLQAVLDHEREHAAQELAYFGHDLFERAVELGGRANPSYAVARERNVAWAVGRCLAVALKDADVVVAPAYGPAWKSDLTLGGHPGATSGITMAPAIAGWPIATVPMGLVDDLPVGLALVGRPGSEPALLAVAAVLEREVGLVGSGALRPRFLPPARS